MVSFQEAPWLSVVFADDANPTGPVESQSVPQRQGHVGQSYLLDWNLYWSKSSVQSLLDHLISPLV